MNLKLVSLASLISSEVFIILSALQVLSTSGKHLALYTVSYFFTSLWLVFFYFMLGGGVIYKYSQTKLQRFISLSLAGGAFSAFTCLLLVLSAVDLTVLPLYIALGTFLLSGMVYSFFERQTLTPEDFKKRCEKLQVGILAQIVLFSTAGIMAYIEGETIGTYRTLAFIFLCLATVDVCLHVDTYSFRSRAFFYEVLKYGIAVAVALLFVAYIVSWLKEVN